MPQDDSAARIDPLALVSPEAILAPGVEVGPFCRIGPGVVLEEDVHLISHVVIEGPTRIGARTTVHPFAVLGGPPQHKAYRGEPTELRIGPDCTVREHVSVNRGTVQGGGLTQIGARALVMAGTHIGHDCRIGDDVTMAGCALAGHVEIGDFAILGGQSAVHQFTRIGERAMIGGLAAVTADVIPYGLAFGNHARLEGLNLVGLKRMGLSRDRIDALRRAFHDLFGDDGRPFRERLAQAERDHAASPEAARVLAFIREGGDRPLMGTR